MSRPPNAWFFDGFLFSLKAGGTRLKSYEHLSGWLMLSSARGLLPVPAGDGKRRSPPWPPSAPRQVISIPRPQALRGASLLVKWLVDEAIRRWQEASPANLQLWGIPH